MGRKRLYDHDGSHLRLDIGGSVSAFFLTPLVIAQRMPQLWFEALHPNPMISDESRLAVTEKVEAFSESFLGGQIAVMNAPMNMALDMMRGRSPFDAAMGAHSSITKATTHPIEKRLRSNLRRLSKRR